MTQTERSLCSTVGPTVVPLLAHGEEFCWSNVILSKGPMWALHLATQLGPRWESVGKPTKRLRFVGVGPLGMLFPMVINVGPHD